MNKKKLLIAAAAAALMAGAGSALAQETPHGAPTEKAAPKGPAADHQNIRPTPSATPLGAAQNRGTDGRNAVEQSGERGNANAAPRRETTAQARGTGNRNAGNNQTREEQGARGNERGEVQGAGGSRETTGQGAAAGRTNITANVTPEQRTRIHDVILRERSAPRVDHVNFNLSVGTRVPRSVRFVEVPRDIVEIEPAWRGYDYFMVGERFVIVDPVTMEIVAVMVF